MPERGACWSRITAHSTLVSAHVLLALGTVAMLGLIGLSAGVSRAARSGYAVHTIRLQPGVVATAFDAGANRLFVATRTTIGVRDATTGRLLQTIRLPMPALQGETTLLLDTPDGRLIVGTTRDGQQRGDNHHRHAHRGRALLTSVRHGRDTACRRRGQQARACSFVGCGARRAARGYHG